MIASLGNFTLPKSDGWQVNQQGNFCGTGREAKEGGLERSADGLTAKVLAGRLLKLVRSGILEKQTFPEIPPRVEYHLTEFGKKLLQIIDQVELLQQEQGDVPIPQEDVTTAHIT